MFRFIVGKSLRAAITLALCVSIVFVVLRLSGDPTDMLLPDDTPADVKAEYRARWGLDRSIPAQFLSYVLALMRGDFGVSFADGRQAWMVVAEAIPNTLWLGSAAVALGLAVGVPVGIVAALKRNSVADRALMSMAVVGFSLPSFFLAILMILVFALHLRWLPSSGVESWRHMILPAVTLSAALLGKSARFSRTSMLEVLGQPYIRSASAKGVSRVGVMLRHAFPNAAAPLLMFLGVEVGLILSGAAVVETVFAWPGLGRLLVSAASDRDLPVVQACILFVAFVIVVSNLAVDLAQAALDPRVDLTGARGRA